MSTLIRFEDRYGVATLAQQICMMLHEGADIEALGYKFESAIGIPGILRLKEREFEEYYKSGVRRIIFVFDLDSDDENKHQLLSSSKLLDNIDWLERHYTGAGVGIQLEYLPTVYMAETLALYQGIHELNVLPELCVNRHSFKILQTCLLRVLFQLENDRKVKRFSEYLIPDRIIVAAKQRRSAFNDRLFEILLNLENHGYDKEEAVEHCAIAVQLFDACTHADISIDLFGYKFTNHMSVDEMRQQVTNYLISIGKKQRR